MSSDSQSNLHCTTLYHRGIYYLLWLFMLFTTIYIIIYYCRDKAQFNFILITITIMPCKKKKIFHNFLNKTRGRWKEEKSQEKEKEERKVKIKGRKWMGGLRFYIVISEAHLSHSISPFLRWSYFWAEVISQIISVYANITFLAKTNNST